MSRPRSVVDIAGPRGPAPSRPGRAWVALSLAALLGQLGCGGTEAIPPEKLPLAWSVATPEAALPHARLGEDYATALGAVNGTPPYTFSVDAATPLPAGITLDAATGQLKGKPTVPGRSTLGFAVQDTAGARVTRTLTLYVRPDPLLVVTSSAPKSRERDAYRLRIQAQGGIEPYTFSVKTGTVPPGLTLGAGGELAGSPTDAGVYGFTVSVADSDDATAEREFMIEVTPLLPMIATSTLTLAELARPYEAQLAVMDGTPPFVWRVSMGDLPRGISLDPTGILRGQPSVVGRRDFAVELTDQRGRKDTRALGITVLGPLAIASRTVPTVLLNRAFTYSFRATGGRAPYNWAIRGMGLPAGLTLSPEGVLSGTATQPGDYPITVLLQDALGRPPVSRAFTIRVDDQVIHGLAPMLAFPPVCTSTRVSYQTVEIDVPESFQIRSLSVAVDVVFTDSGTYQGRPATRTERLKLQLVAPDGRHVVLCGNAAGLRQEDGCRVNGGPGAPRGVQTTFPTPTEPDTSFAALEGLNAQGRWLFQAVTVLPTTGSGGACQQQGTINSVRLAFRVDRRPEPYVILGGFGTNNLIVDPWVRIAGGNQSGEQTIALQATLWDVGPNGLREGGRGDDIPDPRGFVFSATGLPQGSSVSPEGVVIGGSRTGEGQLLVDDGQGNTLTRRLLVVPPDWNTLIRQF